MKLRYNTIGFITHNSAPHIFFFLLGAIDDSCCCISNIPLDFIAKMIDQNNAYRSITSSLYGISSNLPPNDASVFAHGIVVVQLYNLQ